MTREEQIEQAAKKYAVSNDNDPNLTWARECAFMQGAVWADEHPSEEIQRLKTMFESDPDTYEQGYKDAVDKVCELIFEYNKRQAKKFGAKSMMRLPDYTINVGDFRKIMEKQQ